jgi:hypothetical protein
MVVHELDKEFVRGHWRYAQVSRHGDIVIYRQSHLLGTAERFEVIQVQRREARPLPSGQMQEAGEWYPSSSSWGKDGWTCFTLEEANTLAQTLALERPPAGDDRNAAPGA